MRWSMPGAWQRSSSLEADDRDRPDEGNGQRATGNEGDGGPPAGADPPMAFGQVNGDASAVAGSVNGHARDNAADSLWAPQTESVESRVLVASGAGGEARPAQEPRDGAGRRWGPAVVSPGDGSGDAPPSYAAVPIERDDDLAAVFGKIDAAGSPRVALIAPRGNHELGRRLGMRRLQRHLDLTGKDIILVTHSRVLRVRAREEGVPSVTSLKRVDFDRVDRPGLYLGWMTLRLPTLGALLAIAVFVASVVAGAAVLFWYVPTATVTVFVPAQTMAETIDITADRGAQEVNVENAVVPARRREISVQRTLPGPATGVSVKGVEHAAVGVTFANRGFQAVAVPKGTVVVATNGMMFTTGNDVNLPARFGATGEAVALAQQPGTQGNVPARSVTRVEGPLNAQVTVTNPNAAEKGTDHREQVVSDNDVQFLRTLAEAYLADAAKKEILRLYAESETVFGDSVKLEVTDAQPMPAVGQPARYTEVQFTARASMLTAADEDLRRIWVDRFRTKLGADKMLLEEHFKTTVEKTGGLDPIFDRLPVTLRVNVPVAPYVDPQQLARELSGKSRAGVERAVRERVQTDVPPAVEMPRWAPWLPRKANRIAVIFKPAP